MSSFTRRSVVSAAGYAVAASTALGQTRNSRRPNILFICSDQHSGPVLGASHHPVVKTPNLDALAARGVNFQNSYCGSPVCVPGRACMMRGHGITTVGGSVMEATLTAIKLNELAEMNYRAQLLGNPQPIPDDEIAHITRGKNKSTHQAPLWRYYCSLVGEK